MAPNSRPRAAAAAPPVGPLAGLVVLDLSRVLAGPYCTLLLSDLGARVIKVEMPGVGDDARHVGPFLNGRSLYFAAVNRGKESIALDLKDEQDRNVFDALLAQADVLVENFRPGTMERLGYGWNTLRARFPRLIYAATSGFGQTGPSAERPAYDMVIQGMSGIMSITGHPGGPPTRVGTSIGDIAAGLFTATAVNAALLHRERTQEATMVDVAMLDCQLAILENAIARYTGTGEVPGPTGARHPSITPFEPFESLDGYVIVAAGNDGLFLRLCSALERADLAADPRFASNRQRTVYAAELRLEVARTMKERLSAYWLTTLEAAGVPCGPINTIPDALANPQVAHRNMIVDVPRPDGPTLRLAGNPMKISAFPDLAIRRAPPDLDADRSRILSDFGIPAEDTPHARIP